MWQMVLAKVFYRGNIAAIFVCCEFKSSSETFWSAERYTFAQKCYSKVVCFAIKLLLYWCFEKEARKFALWKKKVFMCWKTNVERAVKDEIRHNMWAFVCKKISFLVRWKDISIVWVTDIGSVIYSSAFFPGYLWMQIEVM